MRKKKVIKKKVCKEAEKRDFGGGGPERGWCSLCTGAGEQNLRSEEGGARVGEASAEARGGHSLTPEKLVKAVASGPWGMGRECPPASTVETDNSQLCFQGFTGH